MKIKLDIGDTSDDGHGKTDYVLIESNLTTQEIVDAYFEFFKDPAFQGMEEFCSEYGDSKVPLKILNKLHSLGLASEIKFWGGTSYIPYDPAICTKFNAWTDTYPLIWLNIAKATRSDFEFKIITDDIAYIDIGGYGLFE